VAIEDFEELQLSSFINVTAIGWRPPTLTANFGAGYSAGAVVAAYGLRRWTLQADVLPDSDEFTINYIVDGDDFTLPRFSYFLDFFQRHLMLGNKPFVIKDPRTAKKYLVGFSRSIVESGFDADQITATVLSGGTELEERRVSGVTFNADGSIDLDYTPPTGTLSVSGSSPYSGIRTITATVADNVAVTKVLFYIDYELFATDLSSPWTVSWDTRLFRNGDRPVRAVVYDAAGNTLELSGTFLVENNNSMLFDGDSLLFGGDAVLF
jgi:hypothetical protein